MPISAYSIQVESRTFKVSVDVRLLLSSDYLRFEGSVLTKYLLLFFCSFLGMFQNASSFDQTLSLNLSIAEDLTSMFRDAASFSNGGVPLGWLVNNVKSMASMFENTNHNFDLREWNTQSVESFSRMFANNPTFQGASLFNWNTSSATDMSSFFDGCVNFRGDLVKFDVSNVRNMSAMFRGASSWSADISGWMTKNVEDMSYLFAGCSFFNRDLEEWSTENVENMTGTFKDATSFFGLISSWNTGKVEDFTSFCEGATKFDGDLSGWDMKNVKSIKAMFRGAAVFNRNINQWEVEHVWDMTDAFAGANSLDQSLCWELDDRVQLSGIFDGSQACFDPDCVQATLRDMYICEGAGGSGVSSNATESNSAGDNGGGADSTSNEANSGSIIAIFSQRRLYSSLILILTTSWIIELL